MTGKAASTVAKKAAKDIAQDIAVQQAMDIIWNYQLKEFMSDNEPDKAFACIGKKVSSPEQCPEGKKVYFKKDLTSTDKKMLENTVETVLEEKTMTSSKWGKFLDWFIPLFLVAGTVETFKSVLDPDAQNFLDEVALESLQRSGLMSPYQESSSVPMYDFNDYISNVTVDFDSSKSEGSSATRWYLSVYFDVKKDFDILVRNGRGIVVTLDFKAGDSTSLNFSGHGWGLRDEKNKDKYFHAIHLIFLNNQDMGVRFESSQPIYNSMNEADIAAGNWINGPFYMEIMSKSNNINMLMNYLFGKVAQNNIWSNVPEQSETEIKITIDDLLLSELLKDLSGNVTLPGIDYFIFKTPDGTEVYPDTSSRTGWRNKSDDEPIYVNENDLDIKTKEELVPQPEPEPEPTEPGTDTQPNLPWQLIIALLELLKAILLFMVRLFNFVFDLPFVPEKPINNSAFQWFRNAEWLGIRVYSVISSIATFLLAMTIYRIVRRVF